MTPFLSGKTVLLTRPRRQAEESRPLLEAEGASVLVQPVQEILPAKTLPPEMLAPEFLTMQNRIIFSSSNGVLFFLRALEQADLADGGVRCRLLRNIPLAAVGPGTALELKRAGFYADVIPVLHSAEGLIEELRSEARSGGRFLSVRGDRGRMTLKEGLTALGGRVCELGVYRVREIEKPDETIVRLMDLGKIHYTFVTSSATGAGIVRLFGETLRRTKLVSISPLTSASLAKAGHTVAHEAADATVSGMIDALRTG